MKVRNKIIAWVENSNNINELKNALIEILDNNSVDLDELFRNHKNEINNTAKKKQKNATPRVYEISLEELQKRINK